MSRWLALGILLWTLLGQALAAVDVHPYRDDGERERFQRLTQELRCPKCQNQDLADSNAPIAADLRQEIHRLMAQGLTDDAIVSYLEQRYGEFIRYRPAFDARTLVLWLAPAVGLVAGGVTLLILTRRRPQERPLSAAEQARLAELQREEPRP